MLNDSFFFRDLLPLDPYAFVGEQKKKGFYYSAGDMRLGMIFLQVAQRQVIRGAK